MQITELLQRVHDGDHLAMDAVIPLVYGELKKLAAGHLRREGGAKPLETTVLVHEAFLRLARGSQPSYENRAHFFGIASRLMRQILVDQARASSTEKRDARIEVQLSGVSDLGRKPDETVLVVNEALDRLEQDSTLRAQLIEMRYFGGMTVAEIATFLKVSGATVDRDLRFAEAWLRRELTAAGQQ